MAIPKMTDDLNIIQALSDLPNSEDGLTAEDLKAKFDAAGLAIQNFINNKLIPALVAAKIPFAPTNEIDADTIQAAIESVQTQIKDAASGAIVNGSITKEKIASALLERIYGGRVWISADTPNGEYNTANDFPIGQVWLRPQFTVVNEAGDSWTGSGCTAEVSGKDVTITGSEQVASVTATQNLSGIGEQGDRVFILFGVADKDSEITSLGAAVNGADAVALAGDMVLESTLSMGGTLTVQFGVKWPSTSLAKGSVTMKSFTVVNVDKIMRQMTGATEIMHWAEYLWEKAPFTSVTSPEALFVQANNGEWSQIAFDTLPIERGGTGLKSLQADRYVKTTTDGAFGFMTNEEVAVDIGALRVKTGTYTGTGSARTIDLGFTPKLIHIFSHSGPTTAGDYNSDKDGDQPITLGNGATVAEKWYYYEGNTRPSYWPMVKLSGTKLTFSGGHGAPLGNRSGVKYTWTAIY